MSDQKNTAEMLVIGGGVIGTSIAYHAAKAGIDVVLVEKNQFGAATTSQTARAFRTYFPRKPHDSEMATRSLADYKQFSETMGVDLGLQDLGLLTILTSPQQVAELEADLADHREAGAAVEMVTAARAVELNPWLDPDTIEAAVWNPATYRIKPEMIVQGYVEGAKQHGARLFSNVAVTGLDSDSGVVSTTAGDFTAQSIVIAAGPLSGDVAKLAGLDLPVWGQFAELLHSDAIRTDRDVHNLPFTFHPVSGLKTMGMGKAFLVGLERISKQDGLRDIWYQAAVDELPKWYPELEGVKLYSAWTGSLDVTPTKSAIIGKGTGKHERILFAAGFTGHGLAQAPLAGQIIRDLYLGHNPNVDLTPYSLGINLARLEAF
ncbi:FAD-binding oxidoreductase [Streptomyces sp. NBC_01443]|uniref:NAD(P)/FAD-dependent oxidoreductase n=1 Tax=Streptomyces sp. NBC_01443 TaxID=2903868 RepID=UPI002258BDC8|nr:FAD-binding oxidoreductase [Streptomyces sp. NBC_01443]MCX4626197.1 FAD-binding oxidoreductase [Streptomyces sp. NBC_01443]WSW42226.1 FAD-binding oxidoreductase [Streptomyces sp. NBC_01001]